MLGFKGISRKMQGPLTYRQLGKSRHETEAASSRSSTLRTGLLPVLAEDYTDESSNRIALCFERYVKSAKNFIKETPGFVSELRSQILYLHSFNKKVAENSLRYPFTYAFEQLLLRYILLECKVLYKQDNYSQKAEQQVEDRILRLLLYIYNAYIKKRMVPADKIFGESAKAIINLCVQLRTYYDVNNRVIENIVVKLLRKSGRLEDALTLKSILPRSMNSYQEDTSAKNIYKKITSSDYIADGDLYCHVNSDEVIPVDNQIKEANDENAEIKLDHELVQFEKQAKKSKGVLTICLDEDNDLEMICRQEITPANGSYRLLKERRNPYAALANLKPIEIDPLPTDEVKEEVETKSSLSEDDENGLFRVGNVNNMHNEILDAFEILDDEDSDDDVVFVEPTDSKECQQKIVSSSMIDVIPSNNILSIQSSHGTVKDTSTAIDVRTSSQEKDVIQKLKYEAASEKDDAISTSESSIGTTVSSVDESDKLESINDSATLNNEKSHTNNRSLEISLTDSENDVVVVVDSKQSSSHDDDVLFLGTVTIDSTTFREDAVEGNAREDDPKSYKQKSSNDNLVCLDSIKITNLTSVKESLAVNETKEEIVSDVDHEGELHVNSDMQSSGDNNLVCLDSIKPDLPSVDRDVALDETTTGVLLDDGHKDDPKVDNDKQNSSDDHLFDSSNIITESISVEEKEMIDKIALDDEHEDKSQDDPLDVESDKKNIGDNNLIHLGGVPPDAPSMEDNVLDDSMPQLDLEDDTKGADSFVPREDDSAHINVPNNLSDIDASHSASSIITSCQSKSDHETSAEDIATIKILVGESSHAEIQNDFVSNSTATTKTVSGLVSADPDSEGLNDTFEASVNRTGSENICKHETSKNNSEINGVESSIVKTRLSNTTKDSSGLAGDINIEIKTDNVWESTGGSGEAESYVDIPLYQDYIENDYTVSEVEEKPRGGTDIPSSPLDTEDTNTNKSTQEIRNSKSFLYEDENVAANDKSLLSTGINSCTDSLVQSINQAILELEGTFECGIEKSYAKPSQNSQGSSLTNDIGNQTGSKPKSIAELIAEDFSEEEEDVDMYVPNHAEIPKASESLTFTRVTRSKSKAVKLVASGQQNVKLLLATEKTVIKGQTCSRADSLIDRVRQETTGLRQTRKLRSQSTTMEKLDVPEENTSSEGTDGCRIFVADKTEPKGRVMRNRSKSIVVSNALDGPERIDCTVDRDSIRVTHTQSGEALVTELSDLQQNNDSVVFIEETVSPRQTRSKAKSVLVEKILEEFSSEEENQIVAEIATAAKNIGRESPIHRESKSGTKNIVAEKPSEDKESIVTRSRTKEKLDAPKLLDSSSSAIRQICNSNCRTTRARSKSILIEKSYDVDNTKEVITETSAVITDHVHITDSFCGRSNERDEHMMNDGPSKHVNQEVTESKPKFHIVQTHELPVQADADSPDQSQLVDNSNSSSTRKTREKSDKIMVHSVVIFSSPKKRKTQHNAPITGEILIPKEHNLTSQAVNWMDDSRDSSTPTPCMETISDNDRCKATSQLVIVKEEDQKKTMQKKQLFVKLERSKMMNKVSKTTKTDVESITEGSDVKICEISNESNQTSDGDAVSNEASIENNKCNSGEIIDTEVSYTDQTEAFECHDKSKKESIFGEKEEVHIEESNTITDIEKYAKPYDESKEACGYSIANDKTDEQENCTNCEEKNIVQTEDVTIELVTEMNVCQTEEADLDSKAVDYPEGELKDFEETIYQTADTLETVVDPLNPTIETYDESEVDLGSVSVFESISEVSIITDAGEEPVSTKDDYQVPPADEILASDTVNVVEVDHFHPVDDLNVHKQEIVPIQSDEFETSKPVTTIVQNHTTEVNMIMLAHVASVVSQQEQQPQKKRDRRKKVVLQETSPPKTRQKKPLLSEEGVQSKRITRSATHQPDDFLLRNTASIPSINKSPVHKIAEVNVTSEESNDSESNHLLIDERDDITDSTAVINDEEQTISVVEVEEDEDPLAIEKDPLSIYDEDTLEENLGCGTVLLSIPEIAGEVDGDVFDLCTLVDVQDLPSKTDDVEVMVTNAKGSKLGKPNEEPLNCPTFPPEFMKEQETEVISSKLDDVSSEHMKREPSNAFNKSEGIPPIFSTRPIRNMAQRKLLNPYVSIERLNDMTRYASKTETKSNKSRSQSIDIGAIKRMSSEMDQSSLDEFNRKYANAANKKSEIPENIGINPDADMDEIPLMQRLQLAGDTLEGRNEEKEEKVLSVDPLQIAPKKKIMNQCKQDPNLRETWDQTTTEESPNKKYYMIPKLRRKSVSNVNLDRAAHKKSNVDQAPVDNVKPIEILSNCKSTISPTTEKLKKKLECDGLYLDHLLESPKSSISKENVSEATELHNLAAGQLVNQKFLVTDEEHVGDKHKQRFDESSSSIENMGGMKVYEFDAQAEDFEKASETKYRLNKLRKLIFSSDAGDSQEEILDVSYDSLKMKLSKTKKYSNESLDASKTTAQSRRRGRPRSKNVAVDKIDDGNTVAPNQSFLGEKDLSIDSEPMVTPSDQLETASKSTVSPEEIDRIIKKYKSMELDITVRAERSHKSRRSRADRIFSGRTEKDDDEKLTNSEEIVTTLRKRCRSAKSKSSSNETVKIHQKMKDTEKNKVVAYHDKRSKSEEKSQQSKKNDEVVQDVSERATISKSKEIQIDKSNKNNIGSSDIDSVRATRSKSEGKSKESDTLPTESCEKDTDRISSMADENYNDLTEKCSTRSVNEKVDKTSTTRTSRSRSKGFGKVDLESLRREDFKEKPTAEETVTANVNGFRRCRSKRIALDDGKLLLSKCEDLNKDDRATGEIVQNQEGEDASLLEVPVVKLVVAIETKETKLPRRSRSKSIHVDKSNEENEKVGSCLENTKKLSRLKKIGAPNEEKELVQQKEKYSPLEVFKEKVKEKEVVEESKNKEQLTSESISVRSEGQQNRHFVQKGSGTKTRTKSKSDARQKNLDDGQMKSPTYEPIEQNEKDLSDELSTGKSRDSTENRNKHESNSQSTEKSDVQNKNQVNEQCQKNEKEIFINLPTENDKNRSEVKQTKMRSQSKSKSKLVERTHGPKRSEKESKIDDTCQETSYDYTAKPTTGNADRNAKLDECEINKHLSSKKRTAEKVVRQHERNENVNVAKLTAEKTVDTESEEKGSRLETIYQQKTYESSANSEYAEENTKDMESDMNKLRSRTKSDERTSVGCEKNETSEREGKIKDKTKSTKSENKNQYDSQSSLVDKSVRIDSDAEKDGLVTENINDTEKVTTKEFGDISGEKINSSKTGFRRSTSKSVMVVKENNQSKIKPERKRNKTVDPLRQEFERTEKGAQSISSVSKEKLWKKTDKGINEVSSDTVESSESTSKSVGNEEYHGRHECESKNEKKRVSVEANRGRNLDDTKDGMDSKIFLEQTPSNAEGEHIKNKKESLGETELKSIKAAPDNADFEHKKSQRHNKRHKSRSKIHADDQKTKYSAKKVVRKDNSENVKKDNKQVKIVEDLKPSKTELASNSEKISVRDKLKMFKFTASSKPEHNEECKFDLQQGLNVNTVQAPNESSSHTGILHTKKYQKNEIYVTELESSVFPDTSEMKKKEHRREKDKYESKEMSRGSSKGSAFESETEGESEKDKHKQYELQSQNIEYNPFFEMGTNIQQSEAESASPVIDSDKSKLEPDKSLYKVSLQFSINRSSESKSTETVLDPENVKKSTRKGFLMHQILDQDTLQKSENIEAIDLSMKSNKFSNLGVTLEDIKRCETKEKSLLYPVHKENAYEGENAELSSGIVIEEIKNRRKAKMDDDGLSRKRAKLDESLSKLNPDIKVSRNSPKVSLRRKDKKTVETIVNCPKENMKKSNDPVIESIDISAMKVKISRKMKNTKENMTTEEPFEPVGKKDVIKILSLKSNAKNNPQQNVGKLRHNIIMENENSCMTVQEELEKSKVLNEESEVSEVIVSETTSKQSIEIGSPMNIEESKNLIRQGKIALKVPNEEFKVFEVSVSEQTSEIISMEHSREIATSTNIEESKNKIQQEETASKVPNEGSKVLEVSFSKPPSEIISVEQTTINHPMDTEESENQIQQDRASKAPNKESKVSEVSFSKPPSEIISVEQSTINHPMDIEESENQIQQDTASKAPNEESKVTEPRVSATAFTSNSLEQSREIATATIIEDLKNQIQQEETPSKVPNEESKVSEVSFSKPPSEIISVEQSTYPMDTEESENQIQRDGASEVPNEESKVSETTFELTSLEQSRKIATATNIDDSKNKIQQEEIMSMSEVANEEFNVSEVIVSEPTCEIISLEHSRKTVTHMETGEAKNQISDMGSEKVGTEAVKTETNEIKAHNELSEGASVIVTEVIEEETNVVNAARQTEIYSKATTSLEIEAYTELEKKSTSEVSSAKIDTDIFAKVDIMPLKIIPEALGASCETRKDKLEVSIHRIDEVVDQSISGIPKEQFESVGNDIYAISKLSDIAGNDHMKMSSDYDSLKMNLSDSRDKTVDEVEDSSETKHICPELETSVEKAHSKIPTNLFQCENISLVTDGSSTDTKVDIEEPVLETTANMSNIFMSQYEKPPSLVVQLDVKIDEESSEVEYVAPEMDVDGQEPNSVMSVDQTEKSSLTAKRPVPDVKPDMKNIYKIEDASVVEHLAEVNVQIENSHFEAAINQCDYEETSSESDKRITVTKPFVETSIPEIAKNINSAASNYNDKSPVVPLPMIDIKPGVMKSQPQLAQPMGHESVLTTVDKCAESSMHKAKEIEKSILDRNIDKVIPGVPSRSKEIALGMETIVNLSPPCAKVTLEHMQCEDVEPDSGIMENFITDDTIDITSSVNTQFESNSSKTAKTPISQPDVPKNDQYVEISSQNSSSCDTFESVESCGTSEIPYHEVLAEEIKADYRMLSEIIRSVKEFDGNKQACNAVSVTDKIEESQEAVSCSDMAYVQSEIPSHETQKLQSDGIENLHSNISEVTSSVDPESSVILQSPEEMGNIVKATSRIASPTESNVVCDTQNVYDVPSSTSSPPPVSSDQTEHDVKMKSSDAAPSTSKEHTVDSKTTSVPWKGGKKPLSFQDIPTSLASIISDQLLSSTNNLSQIQSLTSNPETTEAIQLKENEKVEVYFTSSAIPCNKDTLSPATEELQSEVPKTIQSPEQSDLETVDSSTIRRNMVDVNCILNIPDELGIGKTVELVDHNESSSSQTYLETNKFIAEKSTGGNIFPEVAIDTLINVTSMGDLDFFGELTHIVEIKCNSYEEGANDHTYYMGDPLFSGKLEENSILPSNFSKPTNGFPLNDRQMMDFSEYGSEDLNQSNTEQLSVANEYAVKNLLMLGGQPSSDTNAFPVSDYGLADIKCMNLIEENISSTESGGVTSKSAEFANVSDHWMQYMNEENPNPCQLDTSVEVNPKVVVVHNEQCLTPTFNISTTTDLMDSFRRRSTENSSSSLTLEVELPLDNPSVAKTSRKDDSMARPSPKKHTAKPKSTQSPKPTENLIPTRRYSRTPVVSPPKKKPPKEEVQSNAMKNDLKRPAEHTLELPPSKISKIATDSKNVPVFDAIKANEIKARINLSRAIEDKVSKGLHKVPLTPTKILYHEPMMGDKSPKQKPFSSKDSPVEADNGEPNLDTVVHQTMFDAVKLRKRGKKSTMDDNLLNSIDTKKSYLQDRPSRKKSKRKSTTSPASGKSSPLDMAIELPKPKPTAPKKSEEETSNITDNLLRLQPITRPRPVGNSPANYSQKFLIDNLLKKETKLKLVRASKAKRDVSIKYASSEDSSDSSSNCSEEEAERRKRPILSSENNDIFNKLVKQGNVNQNISLITQDDKLTTKVRSSSTESLSSGRSKERDNDSQRTTERQYRRLGAHTLPRECHRVKELHRDYQKKGYRYESKDLPKEYPARTSSSSDKRSKSYKKWSSSTPLHHSQSSFPSTGNSYYPSSRSRRYKKRPPGSSGSGYKPADTERSRKIHEEEIHKRFCENVSRGKNHYDRQKPADPGTSNSSGSDWHKHFDEFFITDEPVPQFVPVTTP